MIFYGNPMVVIDAIFEKGMAAALSKIISQAKNVAPFDQGRLRQSLMWKTAYQKSDGIIGDEIDVNPKPMEGFGGVHVEYAVYQEFGTKNMNHANPFLRPAIALYGIGQGAEIVATKMAQELSRTKTSGQPHVKFY
jgi:HK97 gp10 family phage protein